MKYQDYYKTLGIEKSADKAEIKKAYKKLARKYHPDLNKDKSAEAKFKEVTEAYEVLKDSEKRQRYDELGSNWQGGQSFTPPPGWEDMFGQQASSQGMGGFSDFFEGLFGNVQSGGFHEGINPERLKKQNNVEVEFEISPEDAIKGAVKQFTIEIPGNGILARANQKTLKVKIPANTKDGSRIKLSGQGRSSSGLSGDLILKIKIRSDDKIQIAGNDITTKVKITPSEAVLGKEIIVSFNNSKIKVKVPKGSNSGKKLRIKGKGLSNKGKNPGDLYIKLEVVIPENPNSKEEELYQQIEEASNFNPRNL
ncbi:UNVERIFIED_CONTAM: hypothetical protein GTU68_040141 [Idotea baltica]|nr:hypothetical protein [Idotea baltica]